MKLLKENEVESPYDLREMLWYIIPGATLLLLIFLFEYWFAVQIRGVEGYNQNETWKRSESSIDTVIASGILSTRAEGHNAIDTLKNTPVDTVRSSNEVLVDTLKKKLSMRKKLLEDLHTPIFTALAFTHTGEKMFGGNWILSALYILLLLTVCYLLGHVSYIIGTFIYERGLVSKGYSYPYIKLLELSKNERKEINIKNKIENQASQGFYKGIYFWIAVLWISMFVSFTLWGYDSYIPYKIILLSLTILLIVIPLRFKFILAEVTKWTKIEPKTAQEKTPKMGGYLYWTLISLLIISLMYGYRSENKINLSFSGLLTFISCNCEFIIWTVAIALILIELIFRRGFVQSKCVGDWMVKKLKQDNENKDMIFNVANEFEREKIFYEVLFIKLYNRLGNEIDRFSSNYFHIQRGFDRKFIDNYSYTFKKVYKNDYMDLNSHNFWFAKFFVMENSIYLNRQINFWENNYRFTKSLSASGFMAFIYCSISFMMQYLNIREFCSPTTFEWSEHYYAVVILFVIPIIYFIITMLTVQYYIYIYDNRFTRMVLRSFVSIVLSKEFNKK